jgi:TonB family protein
VAVALAVSGGPSSAAVAPAAQANTFDKVFAFDRSLDRNSLQVLILSHDPAAAADTALREGFTRAGIRSEVVPVAAARTRLAAGVVVYLSGEHATPELLDQLAKARVLTITGEPSLVDQGRAAVALEDAGGRPQVVVNPDRAAVEGHRFDAQMLKVARVVRSGRSPSSSAPATAPVLVGLDPPPYPEVARRLRVEGNVVMRLQVDAQGRVTGVEIVTGVSKTSGIDDAAILAARRARFRPATQDGKPVAGTFLLTLPFRL